MSHIILVVIKAVTLSITARILRIKHKLLLLVAINCRRSPESIFSSLRTNRLACNDAELIIRWSLVAWVSCYSSNATNVTRWLSSSSATWLSGSSRLSNKTTYTDGSSGVHLFLYVAAKCLLIRVKHQRWNRFLLVGRLFLIVTV
jgi:hypothetical protein